MNSHLDVMEIQRPKHGIPTPGWLYFDEVGVAGALGVHYFQCKRSVISPSVIRDVHLLRHVSITFGIRYVLYPVFMSSIIYVIYKTLSVTHLSVTPYICYDLYPLRPMSTCYAVYPLRHICYALYPLRSVSVTPCRYPLRLISVTPYTYPLHTIVYVTSYIHYALYYTLRPISVTSYKYPLRPLLVTSYIRACYGRIMTSVVAAPYIPINKQTGFRFRMSVSLMLRYYVRYARYPLRPSFLTGVIPYVR